MAGNLPFRSQQPQQQGLNSKSCYLCGKTLGIDLDHQFPLKNCPELPGLIEANILKFHPMTGRLVKVSDNTELVLSHRGPGGMAAILRQENSGRREMPPHMSCMAMSLCRNDDAVLKGDVSGVSSHAYYSFPVTTRSQKAKEASGGDPPQLQKRVHFHEHHNENPPQRPTVHPSSHEDLQFSHPQEQPKEYPSAPHKANTRGGWEENQRRKQEQRRPDNKNEPKDKPSVRFTSDIQNDVSIEDVIKRVLEQKTSISLRELFAVSPELQKRMGNLVKTRREVTSSATSIDGEDTVIEIDSNSPENDTPGCAILNWEGDPSALPAFLERYADAVSLKSPVRCFARTTGIIKGTFGGEEVTFLIDSGSELNLITRRVWEQTNVEIDNDGARWSLRGLGGANVPLIGCARDAPVQIDGKNFDHHFFVSTMEHGRYDGILGEPWLQWFSADIRHDRFGPTYLQAFPSGDKTGAFISVAITDSKDPRNADKLVLTSEAVYNASSGF